MEELLELRDYIEHQRYSEALVLIGEMEEMSRDDKINKIESFLSILLLHLIKQHAEQRCPRSWQVSMRNAADSVMRVNKRRKDGGYYLDTEELIESIDEIYASALRQASLEALEGHLDDAQLAAKVDEKTIKVDALKLVLEACPRGRVSELNKPD